MGERISIWWVLQPYKWIPSLSPNTIRPSLEAYSEVHCMSESKQDWRNWGILNFTDSKSWESKAYWIWRQQVQLEDVRHTQSDRQQGWRKWGTLNVTEHAKLGELRHNEFDKQQARLEEIRHTEFNTEQDWEDRGILNLTDSKQDWRK